MNQSVSKTRQLQGIVHLHPDVNTRFDRRRGFALTWTGNPTPSPHFLSKLFPNRRQHSLVLDELGRRTIELIDSKRTVDQIATELASKLQLDPAEVQEALLLFLTQLMKRNIVRVTLNQIQKECLPPA